MNFKLFFKTSYILGKHLLKQPVMYILLFCIPLISFFVTLLPEKANSSSVCAGIYFEAYDDFSCKLKDELINPDNSVKFVLYSDEEQLKNDVATSKIECGYVFDKDFTYKIKHAKYNELIKYYACENALLGNAINEVVFGTLIQLCGYSIISDYIEEDDFEADYDEVKEYLFSRYDYYCDSSETFHIDIETIDGLSLNNGGLATLAVSFPLRGMFSILIFLSSLIGSALWLKDRENGLFTHRDKKFMLVSKIVYPLIPALLFIICCEITLHITNNDYNLTTEFFLAFRYLLILFIYNRICLLLFKKSTTIISLIPVLVLLCLVICPIFVNLENIIPAISIISKLLPPGYFL